MKIIVKFLLISLSILFFSLRIELALAEIDDADKNLSEEMQTLIKLLEDKKIAPTTAEGLIHSDQTVGLSRGVWQDSQVAAYQQRFKRKPLVLPFTVPLAKSDSEADAKRKKRKKSATNFHYNTVEPQGVYYLYIHLADEQDAAKTTLAKVQELMGENFQSALADNGFASLNDDLIQLWEVRLGLNEPRFSGGDY